MIDLARLRARIDRLDELRRGLGKEEAAQEDGWWGTVVRMEQQQYVAALRKAREALSEARGAAVRAAQRLEEFGRPRNPAE